MPEKLKRATYAREFTSRLPSFNKSVPPVISSQIDLFGSSVRL